MKRFCRNIIHRLSQPRVLLIGLLGVGVVLLFVIVKCPQWYVAAHGDTPSARDLIKLENQTRATWAQVIAYLVGLGAIYFTWKRLTATERTVEIAQEGQITERFTRAIEQLGSEKLEVRLGGIYALERIARDSEKDHWTIMEVLTAFVRERAPWCPNNTSDTPVRPPKDIQGILTVIGRRKRTYQNGEDFRLDLFRTDLRKADLRAAHLEGANFNGAHVDEANLWEAHLEGAIFWEAYLTRADLRKAHLEGADLRAAWLERAKLGGANLRRANLGGAHMEKVVISKDPLDEANPRGARPEGVPLLEAHFEGADLTRTHLEGADLSGAVGLTQEQVSQAIMDAATKLPDYLARNGQDDSASG